RCLEKDPDDRWQTARDLLLELKWVGEAGSRAGVAAPIAHRRKTRERIAWGVAGVAILAAIALGALVIARTPPKPEPIRFTFDTPGSIRSIGTPKVSPDGRYVAFNATDSLGATRIYVRAMGGTEAQPIPSTEGAFRPFWSPDSKYLGFIADNKMKKVSVGGGVAQSLCDVKSAGDGSWSPSGVILFDGSPTDSVLQVSAGGGVARAATRVDRAAGEYGTAWPQILPDGHHFLYLGLTLKADSTRLLVGDLKSPKTKLLMVGDVSRIEYVSPGYLLFVRDRALLAQRFDPRSLKLEGDAVPVVDNVAAGGGTASNADFSGSENGVIAFRGGQSEDVTSLAWVDRTGRPIREVGETKTYFGYDVSADGRHVAYATGGPPDVWVLDMTRNVSSRFTFNAAGDYNPIWSPDGSRIAFGSDRSGPGGVYVKAASGAGADSVVWNGPTETDPLDWSPDGATLACVQFNTGTRADIVTISMKGDHEPVPFVQTQATEAAPAFSPDGKWLAYASNESGRPEIYVQPFPGPGGKWQASIAGGRDPRWRGDGKELYFISMSGALMAVDVTLGTSVDLGTPHALFQPVPTISGLTMHNYDVSADGQRFLIRKPLRAGELPATSVFINWPATIEKH
ncbi:MAG: TolB family protein, partial [Hyphomicrobiales bacterium]